MPGVMPDRQREQDEKKEKCFKCLHEKKKKSQRSAFLLLLLPGQQSQGHCTALWPWPEAQCHSRRWGAPRWGVFPELHRARQPWLPGRSRLPLSCFFSTRRARESERGGEGGGDRGEKKKQGKAKSEAGGKLTFLVLRPPVWSTSATSRLGGGGFYGRRAVPTLCLETGGRGAGRMILWICIDL